MDDNTPMVSTELDRRTIVDKSSKIIFTRERAPLGADRFVRYLWSVIFNEALLMGDQQYQKNGTIQASFMRSAEAGITFSVPLY